MNRKTLGEFLAGEGAAVSRAEVRRWGAAGAIRVNGTVISDPDHFLVEEDDVVQIGKKPDRIYYVSEEKPEKKMVGTCHICDMPIFSDRRPVPTVHLRMSKGDNSYLLCDDCERALSDWLAESQKTHKMAKLGMDILRSQK